MIGKNNLNFLHKGTEENLFRQKIIIGSTYNGG